MEAEIQRGVAGISGWLSLFISLAFMILMAAAVLSHLLPSQSWIKVLNPTEFAYLAGAWWLIRK